MMIAIGLLACVLLHLALYAHKARREEAFPFDYLSR